MCLEELHVPLPPAEFVEPRQAFYGLLQCLWEHQLELQDQLGQLDQWLSPSELLKGEKVVFLPSSQNIGAMVMSDAWDDLRTNRDESFLVTG
jgi:hypothetical protein